MRQVEAQVDTSPRADQPEHPAYGEMGVVPMDYETVPPPDFGASLRGIGLNLLVRDVYAQAEFLTAVLGMAAHRVSEDFAIMTHGSDLLQLHADHTYGSHPLLGLLPETPPRGAGAAIYLFNADPDHAVKRATDADGVILQACENKPHGLREACILCPNGYAWTPSRPLSAAERAALG